ncbi:SMP-30/gluconolaconase/LRE-like region protein [Medicago truncatula]|uniref:SMP-30/gluconolaconase/LRE-like region protein n=1 Tax=Medicago truncatula TaxID=3880 RepID=A0A072VLP5_MEDTR|nr:SMP-30/gluconolaconase/LRE-like region protein [Medicago truncatula]
MIQGLWVDVAHDGTIYFTDASSKYSIKDSVLDILEGKPNGRFLSYNPATKKTTLLVSDLYFPNGVAVSPDQNFVVFCETSMMNCKKYYIHGSKKGSTDKFCDLPGMPDNIHYEVAFTMHKTQICASCTNCLMNE